MTQLPAFDSAEDRPPLAAKLAPKLHALAEKGVFFGTSSWKYEGWLGSVYQAERYLTRGKHSTAKFERGCLEEYAQVFPTVCGDFAFYQFPSTDYWTRLFEQVPANFLFSFKVPEEITVIRWPTHARYGKRAGQDNDHFLDARLFKLAFLDALEPHRSRVGPLIFEFGTFAKKDFSDELTFFDRLGTFLSSLPRDWRYAVEIRNKDYLCPAYFDTLAGRNVAHVFNAWTRMPTLDEQTSLDDA